MKILLTTLLLSMSLVVYAQDKDEKDKKEKKEKTIEDLTKSSRMIDGLFPIYQDTITGELKMIISHDQLDKDFKYHISTIRTPKTPCFCNTVCNLREVYKV